MKTIFGSRDQGVTSVRILDAEVDINNFVDLPLRNDVIDYSPTFDWGNESAGASQLALALLIEIGNKVDDAIEQHEQFRSEIIVKLHPDGWKMTKQFIKKWIILNKADKIKKEKKEK